MRAPRVAAIRLAAVLLFLPCASIADHETIVVRETDESTEREQSDAAALEALRRTPGGVGLVSDDAIEKTRAASLEDVLESVPGVYVRARGTGEEPQISIRGSGLRNNFHTRGVNVLIDGFPFQNADGFSDVEAFEFLAARRVEVYKGANSLRFGGNSLGGAINIVTQTGRDAPYLRLRSEGGAFGFWKSYGAGAWDAGPWDAFLALSHTQQHGYRDHAEQDRQRAYGSFARRFDGGASLRVDLSGVRNRQELPGALDHDRLHGDDEASNQESESQDERRDFDLGRAAVTVSLPVSDALRIDWQTQTSFQELDHPLAFGIIDNQTWNVGSELRAVSEHSLGELESRFDAGVQVAYTRQPQTIYENVDGHRGNSFARQLGEAANAALYFSEDLALCDSLSLVGGTRAQLAWRRVDDKTASDRDSVDYWFLSPSLGAIWRAVPGAELYANAGYAFEPGVLFELTAPGNATDGLDLDALDPQRAWQFELGARGKLAERLAFDVAVFDMELRDEIRNVNVEPFPGAGFTIPAYANIDRSRHWGVETGLDLALLYGFSTQVSYTYARFEFVRDDEFGNNDLPGAPRHFTTASLRWQQSGFWIAPQVEWVARRWFVDSANQSSAGSYWLWNVRAGYDHEPSGLSLFVEGRNLLDREYVSSVVADAGDVTDAGGRRFFEPGDGRGVFGGVEWRWH
jgi:iron complex outermembrane receptor protein